MPPWASGATPRRCWRRTPQLVVVGLDRDTEALARATDRLAPFGQRFRGVHCVYDQLPEAISGLGYRRVDAILFDLGRLVHAARRR